MKNLVLINKQLEVNGFVKNFDYSGDDNYYNPDTHFWCVEDYLFKDLIERSMNNRLFLKVDIFKRKGSIELTIEDFDIIPIPPKIHLSKEQVLAKAILESELNGRKLEKQNLLLAKALMENQVQNINLGRKVDLLSKAIFELSLKK